MPSKAPDWSRQQAELRLIVDFEVTILSCFIIWYLALIL
jgi:hypothetical protein